MQHAAALGGRCLRPVGCVVADEAPGEVVRRLLPRAYVSLSHRILREYREFERTSTTVVNAYIGPKVGGYVRSLKASLAETGFRGDLTIMQSNGGVMTPEVATERPVAMMESGPVGGIIASAQVGRALGLGNVISFDMGGTTAKASLIREGEPTLSPGYYVGGYASGHPVMVPVIDVVFEGITVSANAPNGIIGRAVIVHMTPGEKGHRDLYVLAELRAWAAAGMPDRDEWEAMKQAQHNQEWPTTQEAQRNGRSW